jgi:2-haloalkanoic acid dehalogenase type II
MIPTPSPPKAILFDLDDTLWPIGPVIAEAERLLFDWLSVHAPGVTRRHSIASLRQARLDLLERQPHFHLDLGELRRAGLQAAFADAGEDGAKIDAAMACFHAARNAVTPYPDVLPGLKRLRERFLVGSITNGVANLEVVGMAQHFTVSLAAATFGRAKPDPAIFLAACAALGVAPAEAVYVGDDLQLDVVGAQQAGMRAVWLNRKGDQAQLAAGVRPDAICADLGQLLDWLETQLQ